MITPMIPSVMKSSSAAAVFGPAKSTATEFNTSRATSTTVIELACLHAALQ